MKRRLLLLAGILAIGAASHAMDSEKETVPREPATVSQEKAVEIATTTDSDTIDGLLATRQTGEGISGTYTAEMRVRNYQGPGRSNDGQKSNKIEATLAEGKINMGKLGFIYSVDRDYNMDKNWSSVSEAWDTEFGIDYNMGTFNMLGKTWELVPTVTFGYDTVEGVTGESDYDEKRLFEFTPKMSTTYNGFATDIMPIIAYDDVTGNTAFAVQIDNFRQINDRWATYGSVYLDFVGTDRGPEDSEYGNSIYNSNIDGDNDFGLSIEQYVGYTRQISGNFHFFNEIGLEGYSILQSDANDVAMYIAPEVHYRAKLKNVDVVPYVKYTAYTATGGYESDPVEGAYYRNDLSVGVRFGTKF